MTNINSRKFLIAKWTNLRRINIGVFYIPILYFCSIFVSTSSFSQRTIKVENSIGSCFIEGDVSPNKAKIKALNEAKIKALSIAGISENIYNYKTLYKQQENKNFEQVFTTQFQSELKGNIIHYEIKNERIYCKSEFEIIYEITIDADVIEYKSELDNKFQVKIENLRPTYINGDEFGFNLQSTVDCYITIFDLLDTTAKVVYPLVNVDSEKIDRNEVLKFPFEGNYSADLSSENINENHRLLLVFTKEKYPFIFHDVNYFTSYDKVINWVNSIEPSQKNIQYYGFIILPK
jgi:hypothetical protein